MKEEEFLAIMKRMIENEEKIMCCKGMEYTSGDLKTDRLANFYRIAKELDQDPKVVCYIYAKKHWDSITNYVKCGKEYSNEKISGRINDLRNYMILLNAIIIEQNKELSNEGVHQGW
mgnify:CR=1 FL=1